MEIAVIVFPVFLCYYIIAGENNILKGTVNMKANLADKLRELRKSRNVSQEKLASYLNVSSQAISKWECGVTSPDISLLPYIARFFGISVDELLQAEKIDEISYIRMQRQITTALYR